jgi:NNP family nitrate/nitrite transporter-like MFS transporter
MIVILLFVQANEGSTFSIASYIDPASTGSISGIVGAGSNSGAVGFGMEFGQLDYKEAFRFYGCWF